MAKSCSTLPPIRNLRLSIRRTSIGGSKNQYIPSPDGQRFLVVTLLEESARPPITVVVNWTAINSWSCEGVLQVPNSQKMSGTWATAD
jgi:hypothetical protein